MRSLKGTRYRRLVVLALAVGVTSGALLPTGSTAQAQALLWATQAGGAGIIDEGLGIATTERGDSYVTGFFNQGTTTFGEDEPNETTLTSAGGSDIFVAKFAPDGALLWANRAGGTGRDLGRGIATTERGDSYVTGHFTGTATFGQDEPNETTLTSAGRSDIFVAKYNRDGALLWAIQAGGTDIDQGLGIATTERGDSYVTGFFRDDATFGHGRAQPNHPYLGWSPRHLRC